MEDATSSSRNPHKVFNELLNLLHNIPRPICLNASGNHISGTRILAANSTAAPGLASDGNTPQAPNGAPTDLEGNSVNATTTTTIGDLHSTTAEDHTAPGPSCPESSQQEQNSRDSSNDEISISTNEISLEQDKNSSTLMTNTFAVIPDSTPRRCFNCHRCMYENRLEKLMNDVLFIQESLEKLGCFEQDLGRYMEPLARQVMETSSQSGEVSSYLVESRFEELTRAVTHFKFQLPYTSYYKFPKYDSTIVFHQQDSDPTPNADTSTLSDPYNSLDHRLRKCLWCFSVFDAEIKKRVLINWWIGEVLIPLSSGGEQMTLEERGELILNELERKRFIERVVKEKRESDSWYMKPSVRSFIRSKAKENNFFDFDGHPFAGEVVLLKSGDHNDALHTVVDNQVTTVFNVSEPVIDYEDQNLAYMDNLRVLHLGRSQIAVPKQNVQTNFLDLSNCLEKMKNLRLLSFRGIGSFNQIPDAVCRLTSLMVLDLRACQCLEWLPLKIGELECLTHLDVSGCHILRQMPKGISSLFNLEVLKGFVLGPNGKSESCTLHDLMKLRKLHKLSIFVWRKNFPQSQDLKELANIDKLLKLKILWKPAYEPFQNSTDEYPSRPSIGRMFTCCFRGQVEETGTEVLAKLVKLDLWCPPNNAAPLLLAPGKFPGLKQLYIRGAEFQQLKYNEDPQPSWDVDTLRLLFSPNLDMTWSELHNLFPKLIYLQMQDCPKLHEFSQHCDDGIWLKND